MTKRKALKRKPKKEVSRRKETIWRADFVSPLPVWPSNTVRVHREVDVDAETSQRTIDAFIRWKRFREFFRRKTPRPRSSNR